MANPNVQWLGNANCADKCATYAKGGAKYEAAIALASTSIGIVSAPVMAALISYVKGRMQATHAQCFSECQIAEAAGTTYTPPPGPSKQEIEQKATELAAEHKGAFAYCTDSVVVKEVQTKLGVSADGVWGPKSQAALAKSGKTYQSFVTNGCTGAAPTASTGGGTAPPAPGPGPSPAPITTAAPKKGTNWALILGAAAVGIGAAFYVSTQPKRRGNPAGTRRLNNAERENWIMNDEGLYRWWKSSRKSMRNFIRDNKDELDEAIKRALPGVYS